MAPSKRTMKRRNNRSKKVSRKKRASKKVAKVVNKKVNHTNAMKVKLQVYCMTCRCKVPMAMNGRNLVKTKNGRHMLKGVCQRCDGKVVRII
jgi:predicted ABC-class ATPase